MTKKCVVDDRWNESFPHACFMAKRPREEAYNHWPLLSAFFSFSFDARQQLLEATVEANKKQFFPYLQILPTPTQ